MTIKTTELLKLFFKANQLDLSVEVCEDKDGDYVVRFFKMLRPENIDVKVVITQKDEGSDKKGDLGFYDLLYVLDEQLEKQKKEELKAQKRKELIDRLTPEEKELLGVK